MAAAATRQLVNIYRLDGKRTNKALALPDIFKAPIRLDVVMCVQDYLLRNRRQAHGHSTKAGHQTSAESWGTGRAVARIPRVRGGGTHRSGQGAFGNMCRGGRRFAPRHSWKRLHVKVPRKQRRYAIASAVAASAIPALVEAKGHIIEKMPEFPMVVSNDIQSIKKTKEAVQVLKKLGAYEDCERSWATRKIRAGKGKNRGRKYKSKRGPLIIFKNNDGISKAFRNIPGVSLMSTDRMNIQKLAPGGVVGRLVIWTADAFRDMKKYYGAYSKGVCKLPHPTMKMSDLKALKKHLVSRRSVRRPKLKQFKATPRGNPLRKPNLMYHLNPAHGMLGSSLIKAKVKHQIRMAQLQKENPAEALKLHEKFRKQRAVLGIRRREQRKEWRQWVRNSEKKNVNGKKVRTILPYYEWLVAKKTAARKAVEQKEAKAAKPKTAAKKAAPPAKKEAPLYPGARPRDFKWAKLPLGKAAQAKVAKGEAPAKFPGQFFKQKRIERLNARKERDSKYWAKYAEKHSL